MDRKSIGLAVAFAQRGTTPLSASSRCSMAAMISLDSAPGNMVMRTSFASFCVARHRGSSGVAVLVMILGMARVLGGGGVANSGGAL
eukprot:234137-Rhodomonas_salina.1